MSLGGFEFEHFRLQSVDGYVAYEKTRANCTEWSLPTSLATHTLKQMRATYPFPKDEQTLRRISSRFFAGCTPYWNMEVHTCVLPAEIRGDVQHQWTFTRVGPVPVGPDAYLCLALIAKMPASPATTFLVSSSDGYFADTHDGGGYRAIGFPPLHPHHSNSFMVGYHPSITQRPLPGFSSPFERFYPWPAYSTHQLNGAQASMNSPGFNADFVGCRPSADASVNACSYLRMPPGYGWPVFKNTDMWSTSLINRVGSWHEGPGKPAMSVVFEYGREFVSASAESSIRPVAAAMPVWSLDFAVVGNGNTYELGRFAHLEAIMFHTYWMPVGGRVIGSWYHTHAQSQSEFWILSAPHLEMLPRAVYSKCQQRKLCQETSKGANGTTGRDALPLYDTGYDIMSLQAHVRLAAQPRTALRCEYRSTADYIDGELWGRQSVRAIASRGTCDDWTFPAGQPITLIAFAFKQPVIVQQHNRWFAVMQLTIPKQKMAGGPIPEVGGDPIQGKEGQEDDRSNSWMEYMG